MRQTNSTKKQDSKTSCFALVFNFKSPVLRILDKLSFLFAITFFLNQAAHSQVVYKYVGGGNLPLYACSWVSTPCSIWDGLSSGNRIVVTSSTSTWGLANRAANSNDPAYKTIYGMINSNALIADPSTGYVLVTGSGISGLRMRAGAGTSYPIVQITGIGDAKGWDGQYFATTGNTQNVGGTVWYECYVTTECAQNKVWMSGAYLVYTPGIPLPLNWISFSAKKIGNDVSLNWEISNATNVKEYVIEKSYNSNDFKTIGTYQNVNRTKYSFTDFIALKTDEKQIFYRIKEFDNDGKFAYSSIVVVENKHNDKTVPTINLYPNPTTNFICIQWISQEKSTASILVKSLSGMTLKNQSSTILVGKNDLKVDVSTLPKGLYIINIVLGEQTITERFIKN